ncbi:Putative nucleic acid-binding protein, contains PIN domain OS=Oscillatoria acuminata PCC 6304 GN=Oscil6304_5341 PE=4 SV=1 [Gemmataceae bacterium]|nr:Putative nucleic acid-binding protein, contains PIN domain OS=Oscillatoria acuminata PCC 6304 GN=Oscil6304_5341 PE=4 SV=1 [Gemmataceae bacterium]VTT96704.1 Putative nucleic acid-binding protein, contains PIN domain OS=Oscillatoria acuminata PCC 6304 GN=Oscil6304_5341 PE=4 SV=1 [Gemmataceae bacterium]
MAVFILDTTTLTHLQRKHPRVTDALDNHTGDVVGTTKVNVEEVVGGWIALIRRSKTNGQEARASAYVAAAMEIMAPLVVFAKSEAALDRFDQLVRLKLNVGKMDLKIAAVALGLDATVVTDNAIDFGRVPGLKWEDWTV